MPKKCPLNKLKPCVEDQCALWVELYGAADDDGVRTKTGRCAHAWTPLLMTENTEAIQRIAKTNTRPTDVAVDAAAVQSKEGAD